MSLSLSDQQAIFRIATTKQFEAVSGEDVKRCIRNGYSTIDVARAYFERESAVWNRMVADAT